MCSFYYLIYCIKMCNNHKSPNQLSSFVAKSVKAVNIGSLSRSNSISVSSLVVTFSFPSLLMDLQVKQIPHPNHTCCV